MKKISLSFLLKIAVSLTLILILLYIMRDKYAQIWSVLKGTDMVMFSFGVLVFIAALATASLRLKLIVQVEEGFRITFLNVLSLTFIGYFFNNFLPTAIGGDVVKAYYLSKRTSNKMASYTAVFIDRAMGLVTMVFMAVCALLLAGGRVIDNSAQRMIYAIAIGSLFLIIFIMNKNFAKKFSFLLHLVKPIRPKLEKIYNTIHEFKKHRALMLQSLLISIASQLIYFASIGIAAMSIGLNIPVMSILLRMPIVSAVSLLPSINGIGVREGSTVLLFGSIVGKGNAFALSILLFAVLMLTSILGGIIYGLSPQFRMGGKEPEE